MANYYEFQDCFSKHQDDGESKDTAYRACLKLHKAIGKTIKGEVFKDGKPKHNLYDMEDTNNISEGAILKIDKLLTESEKNASI